MGGSKWKSNARIDRKVVVITGATSGIGLETARDLAHRGARVILASRNMDKAAEALEDIFRTTGNNRCEAMYLDLQSLQCVADFAKKLKEKEDRVDILINNAGIAFEPRTVTVDGYENVFQSNYLGHFLLTILLLDVLKKSAPCRVINVSSLAYSFTRTINFDDINLERNYNTLTSYNQSKLAQVISTLELSRLLEGTGVSVFSLHPGAVKTNIIKPKSVCSVAFVIKLVSPITQFFLKDAVEGAQTSIYCAVEEGLEKQSGGYFADCEEKRLRDHARDIVAAKRLWDMSFDMLKPWLTSEMKDSIEHL